jgi:putative hydrolase of the HAD superfamily
MVVARAVVFDRDGVLTDFDLQLAAEFLRPLAPLPIDEILSRWVLWQEEYGFPKDLVEEESLWISFWDDLSDEFHLGSEQRCRLRQFNYTSVIRPFPEVRAVLTGIKARGVRCGVLSNFSLASLDASLVAAGLADLIDVACAGPVIGAMKPEAEAYRCVMQALSVEAEECLFFDDDVINVRGARALGMRAYRVDRTRTHDALLEGVVHDLSSCLNLLTSGSEETTCAH